MGKKYLFKSVIYVLVFSLLNLQFSSIAYGMKGHRAPSISVDKGEDYEGGNGIALRPSISKLSEAQTLNQPFLDQHTPAASHTLPIEGIKESFKPILRSFVEKFHNE